MKIEVLDSQDCEPVFSSRDRRYILSVDGFVTVQVVKCEHRDHPRLGDLQIEEVKFKHRTYSPKDFESLPEEYAESLLYRTLIQCL